MQNTRNLSRIVRGSWTTPAIVFAPDNAAPSQVAASLNDILSRMLRPLNGNKANRKFDIV